MSVFIWFGCEIKSVILMKLNGTFLSCDQLRLYNLNLTLHRNY